MAEAGRTAGLRPSPVRPHRDLVQAAHGAPDLEPPGLHAVARVAELRERNAQLGRPAQRVDGRRGLPHGVPRLVEIRVALVERVALDARRVHLERGAPEVIVERVEDDLDPVGVGVPVAPDEPAHDPGRAQRVVHARADVDRLAIVQEPHLGALRRGLSGVGLRLPKPGRRRRRAPRRLVEAAVDRQRARPRGGGHLRGRIRVTVAEVTAVLAEGERRKERGHRAQREQSGNAPKRANGGGHAADDWRGWRHGGSVRAPRS